jgi:hypothetical protein
VFSVPPRLLSARRPSEFRPHAARPATGRDLGVELDRLNAKPIGELRFVRANSLKEPLGVGAPDEQLDGLLSVSALTTAKACMAGLRALAAKRTHGLERPLDRRCRYISSEALAEDLESLGHRVAALDPPRYLTELSEEVP